MKTSPDATGSNFNRLLADFIARGGDLDRCPFDTADYKWEEPPYRKDCDYSPVIDEFREPTGTTPTEEESVEWEKEYQEIIKRKPAR